MCNYSNKLCPNSVYSDSIEYKPMDPYKIEFVCNRKPDDINLKGIYFIGMRYIGRSYNGLFEISPKWGSNYPTKVINKKLFDEYFELVKAS